MRFLHGALITLIVLGLVGVLFIYSGLYNIAAGDDHAEVTSWVLHTTMHQSVKKHAADIDVPENLVNEDRVRQGARAYDQLCAACHLTPGKADSLIRQGLNPTPPVFSSGSHWSAAEQFWIIKNGIKMTGMPAWGVTHDDESLWELTAFLQRLPSLSEEQYVAMVRPNAENGQADDGHDHEHTEMSGMTGTMSDEHDEAAPDRHH